jgi:para-nitrobenzyl esterase
MDRIFIICAGTVAWFLALTGVAATVDGLTVATTRGDVVGQASPYGGTIRAFHGIPFAAPPVGRLRWRAPETHPPWSEPRPANTPGSPCWQPLVPETSIYSRGPIEPSEDCLNLNVWAPPAADEPRPVMVWFHGGSNTTGHGSSLIFDGTRLAEKGVVVVTANYRMGVFGFLAHPALSAESAHESSGNYALLDQLAVLKWVRDNAAAFGGDPSRVVIFGQSAGALDVCLLMASPLTRGLISGAIAHSAGCMRVTTTLAEAQAQGERILREFGTSGPEDLRRLPAAEIAEKAANAGVPLSSPIVDGWIIPDLPRRIFGEGRQNRIPLIVGDMADEFRGLGEGMPEMTADELEARVREMYPGIAGDLLDLYAPIAERSPREALWKISTHGFFTWQSRTWADLVTRSGDDAWVYHFTQPTAVFSLYIPERPEFPDPNGPRGMGAYHSGDLAYHFNNIGIVGLGWEDWDFRLADLITDYWVNFARTGNPNGPGVPDWPVYRRAADRIQEFGPSRVWTIKNPNRAALDLFDQALPEP